MGRPKKTDAEKAAAKAAKASKTEKPAKVAKAEKQSKPHASLKDDLKPGEKKLYIVLSAYQLEVGPWDVEVTRGGLGRAARGLVQIQTIGFKPKKGDKVNIERNYTEVDEAMLLTVTKA